MAGVRRDGWWWCLGSIWIVNMSVPSAATMINVQLSHIYCTSEFQLLILVLEANAFVLCNILPVNFRFILHLYIATGYQVCVCLGWGVWGCVCVCVCVCFLRGRHVVMLYDCIKFKAFLISYVNHASHVACNQLWYSEHGNFIYTTFNRNSIRILRIYTR